MHRAVFGIIGKYLNIVGVIEQLCTDLFLHSKGNALPIIASCFLWSGSQEHEPKRVFVLLRAALLFATRERRNEWCKQNRPEIVDDVLNRLPRMTDPQLENPQTIALEILEYALSSNARGIRKKKRKGRKIANQLNLFVIVVVTF